ncbi:hypothetical protein CF326_g7304 [Tilletia indica]|nr:hypothetical protein CF326_g7304 [Tilletia indica]
MALTPIGSTEHKPLKVATFNCGKAGLRKRLTDIFTSNNPALGGADIIFLQECGLRKNLDIEDAEGLAQTLGPHYRDTHRAILTHDAGILFLSTPVTVLKTAHGPRWAYAQISLRPLGPSSAAITTMDVWSIHGPVQSFSFWNTTWTTARDAHSRSIDTIIGADWNAIPDPSRDSLRATPGSCPWSTINPTLAPMNVYDAYRYMLPEGRSFTRMVTTATGTISSAKRLDSIWISRRLLQYASHPRFGPTSSDHHAAAISLDLGVAFTPPPPPKTQPWVLHPGNLRATSFRVAMLAACSEIGPPLPTTSPDQAVRQWSDFILRIRDIARSESIRVGRALKATRDNLGSYERQVEALDLTSPAHARRFPILLSRIHRARRLLQDSEAISATSHTKLKAFRPSNWSAALLHRTGGSQNIRKLYESAGTKTEDPDRILQLVHIFYSNLYTPPSPPANHAYSRAQLLSASETTFTTEDRKALDCPFDLDEVSRAITTASQYSASGPMGLTYPLLRLTSATTAPHILGLIHGLRQGVHYPILLQTTLLHKKGDRANLANYRPISVSDSALRVITRAAARRLQSATDHSLPWYQAAFMPGRRTSTIAGALLGIIDHVGAARPGLPSSIFILSLDQQKAYDRVSHPWLWDVLSKAGSPDSFTALIKSLYSDPHTQLMVNGRLTEPVKINTGLLQGDPLSCALYNLALQPLLDLLASLRVGIDVPGLGRVTCLAFADDVIILLPGTPEGLTRWNHIMTALQAYEDASGARLNWDKSGFVEVCHPSHPTSASTELRSTLLARGFRALDTENCELIHLGHPINLMGPGRPCLMEFHQRVAAMGVRRDQLQTTGTDLLTRVRICNSIITPKLWHHTAVGGLPIEAKSLISQATRPYLYRGDKPWFVLTEICRPYHLGGLGLIHPDHMFTAQSMNFLAHHLLREDGYGEWLRHGIAWTLHNQYQCSPAAFLLQKGTLHNTLSADSTRAAGFWGRLIHALANVNVTIDPSWIDLDTDALMELPWYIDGSSPPLPNKWTPQDYLKLARRGWLTWGDILWRSQLSTRSRTFPRSWPLGPPSPAASLANSRPRPDSFTDLKGPGLATIFTPYWLAHQPRLRRKLQESHTQPFESGPDPSLPLPRIRDPIAKAFPWDLLRIDGRPIDTVTTKHIRLKLCSQDPITVEWTTADSSLTPPDSWGRAWKELHECPLPSSAISDCFLWMHRRTWLAIMGTTIASCPQSGCTARESQEHSYATCAALQPLWAAAITTLRALGIHDDIDLAPHQIALGWPDIRKHRPRLILWRTAVIHLITDLRRPALSRFKNTKLYTLPLPTPSKFRGSLEILLADAITTAWELSKARRPLPEGKTTQSFTSIWIKNSNFVSYDPTAPRPLHFHFHSNGTLP